MGWHFNPAAANLAGWLSWGAARIEDAPSPVLESAHNLLRTLKYAEDGRTGFVSETPEWEQRLKRISADYKEDGSGGFSPDIVRKHLRHLVHEFSGFNLFALGISVDQAAHDRLVDWTNYVARYGNLNALFLLPEEYFLRSDVDIAAPFPAMAQLPDWITDSPGVAFWTRTERTTFAKLSEIDSLYALLVEAQRRGGFRAIDAAIEEWDAKRRHGPRVIQMSDLHFGRQEARDRKTYLLATVKNMVRRHKISNVIMTGDLFDNPSESDAAAFRDFYDALTIVAERNPILIPGNHDKKWFGMLKWSQPSLSGVDWRTIVVDTESRVVFFCFDSASEGEFAKGKVGDAQRIQVGKDFEIQLGLKPEIEKYLRVAALHHHPVSFDVTARSTSWRFLTKLGLGQERFLRMEDADGFLTWCAARQIPLVLHGHKHVPFSASIGVRRRAGPVFDVHCVGCGSSTGTGGWPMSMNIVSWQGDRWSVRYLADLDGRGFEDDRITVQRVTVQDG